VTIDWTTPLIEINASGDVRRAMLANALSVTDLRAAIQEQEPKFRALLGPAPLNARWDLSRPFRCTRTATGGYLTEGVSTCGLVCSGLLRRVIDLSAWSGSYWDWKAPYHRLDVVSALTQLGHETGARRPAGERARPGDPVCIGSGLQTHVLTAAGWNGEYLLSVDGGQIDDAAHRFLQRTRACKRLWDALRVAWVLDLDVLARKLPLATWTLPVGWTCVEVPPMPATGPSWALGTTIGVQQALLLLGYDTGAADGILGPKTLRAIKSYQTHHGLVADGIVGPLTRACFEASLTKLGEKQ
jgi:hypothetical protein